MSQRWPQDAVRRSFSAAIAAALFVSALLFQTNSVQAQLGAFSNGPVPSALSSARMSDRALSYSGCVDIQGRQVAAFANGGVPDVARAFIDASTGVPTIVFNPSVLSWLQPETRLFFFIHECAHHVLGHAVGGASPSTMEQEADCWAINRLGETGLLSGREISAIQADLIQFGRGDHTHLPGDLRADALVRCLGPGAVGLLGQPRFGAGG